jgi:ArsR family transcriptional regulator
MEINNAPARTKVLAWPAVQPRAAPSPARSIMKKPHIAVFEALSHPLRIKMIELLGRKERRMEELSEKLNINQSSISHHLVVLREARLLLTERRGKPAYHRLDKKLLQAALDELARTARLGEETEED